MGDCGIFVEIDLENSMPEATPSGSKKEPQSPANRVAGRATLMLWMSAPNYLSN